MRSYGKLSPFFWTRGSGKRLRGDAEAQVVAAYLATAPTANMIGIYYVSVATIASDTGMSAEQVAGALARIAVARYAFYDFEAELVWIPNHVRFEVGDAMQPKDKRRPKLLLELAQVDGHRFADEFRALYGVPFGLPEPAAAPRWNPNQEAPSKGHPPTEDAPSKGHARLASQSIPIHDQSNPDPIRDRARAREEPPSVPPESGTFGNGTASATEAVHTYETAVREATGGAFAFPRAPFHRDDLCDVLNAHGPPGSRGEAFAWLHATIGDWVNATEPAFAGGWEPSKLLKWLNTKRPKRTLRSPAAVRIRQPGLEGNDLHRLIASGSEL